MHNARLVLLCLLLACAAGSYAAMLIFLNRAALTSERPFGEARRDDAPQLRAYIEIIAIDAPNDSLRFRISFASSPVLRGTRSGSPNQDLRVRLGDADHEQDLSFSAQETMAAATLDVNLNDGTIAAFPLDAFSADLHLLASDATAASLPVQVTAWEGIVGWSLVITRAASDVPGEVRLRFDLRRSPALRVLVLAIYGEMILIAIAALTIGCRTFLGLRPPDSTLIGALTGMVFSLPALRYALPGSVPLGVRADLVVFFSAELGVALGFFLFVVTWAQVRVKT